MSNAAKLKKKAVELEQKKQLDKALALYIQFLQESDGAIDDVDIPLYNRVGDLMLRTGNASDALNYYEKAVDLYADRGFLNNAIALCNKVLRQSPGRASIYYKLGKISANKGFKSDAKKNFLEYADRMQKAGQMEEAFRALKEFADLCPDQDDIRLMLAEQLTKENRQEEALEQLQKLHDKLDSEGRTAEARATVDRMKSIDPEAVPRTSGSYRPQKSQNLIFLDTTFDQQGRPREAAPAASAPPPPLGRLTDPDLVLLTLGDTPDRPVSLVDNRVVTGAFDLDLTTPNDSPVAGELPLLDVADALEPLPAASEIEADFELEPAPAAPATVDLDFEPVAAFALPPESVVPPEPTPIALPVIEIETPAAPVELTLEPSSYESGPPLTIDYASDLANDVTLPTEHGADLFDFRGPPRSDDDFGAVEAPLSTLDPDVSFPSFDLDDMSLPSADEVTSGASLAAALNDEALGDPFAMEPLEPVPLAQPSETDVGDAFDVEPPAAAATQPSAVPDAPLDIEWPAAAEVTASAVTPATDLDAIDVDGIETATPNAIEAAVRAETPAEIPVVADVVDITEIADGVAIDEIVDIADAPTELTPIVVEAVAQDSPQATVEIVTDATPPRGEVEVQLVETTTSSTPATPADVVAVPTPVELAPVVEESRLAGWEVQRANAERLLEAGDRAGGIRELEQVEAELERIGDLERALTIVDELIRLTPDAVRHHQKRVELAFRANDRPKLIDAYLELGDALFRSGEERKARAVYNRVLELAPDDPRARAAVESVASLLSGSMPAIASPPPADARPQPAPRTQPPETHVAYQPGPNNGSRGGNAISPPAQTRKPSPLDRNAADPNFVDLGEWLRSGESPKSTRMVAEEKPPTGDEQADFQEMLKRFKQGVAENVDEEDYESHYDLGVAYKEMGLMDEAVAEFQKALRGSSNRVRAYEALGQCFVEKEQFQVAASVLGRAIALGEGDDHHLVGVLYLLGRATEALNKHGAALDYYQRVFAVDIEFRDVAERISAIERKAT